MDSNRRPSAYQSRALQPGQSSSQTEQTRGLHAHVIVSCEKKKIQSATAESGPKDFFSPEVQNSQEVMCPITTSHNTTYTKSFPPDFAVWNATSFSGNPDSGPSHSPLGSTGCTHSPVSALRVKPHGS